MVAIVSSDTLGVSLSSLTTLGVPGPDTSRSTNGERAFVNVATGNLALRVQDEYLASTGADIAAVRTYNSQGQLSGQATWAVGTVRQSVVLVTAAGTLGQAGSRLARTDADGATAVYNWDTGRGFYVTSDGAGADDTLELVAGGGFKWTDGNTRLVETYSAAGRLSSAVDTDGQQIQYVYDSFGVLQSHTNLGGIAYSYQYDANGFLTSVADAKQSANNRAFVNDAAGRLLYANQGGHVQRQLIANGQGWRRQPLAQVAHDVQRFGSRLIDSSDGWFYVFSRDHDGWRTYGTSQGFIVKVAAAPGNSSRSLKHVGQIQTPRRAAHLSRTPGQ